MMLAEEITMEDIYRKFPTKYSCIQILEKLRWNGEPTCPYCKSKKYSLVKNEHRYHCNSCNTTYSVTVGTLFQDSKLDFQKWFYAIYLISKPKYRISSRRLANDIDVSKDAAWYLIKRIRQGMPVYRELLNGIIPMIKEEN